MLGQLKRLTKDTFSYGFSSALQKLITLFLFPIYARLLTPADFGIQDLIQTTVYIASLFLILGLDSGVLLYYYEAADEEKPKMLSTYLWFEVIISLPIVILVIVFAGGISKLIFNDESLSNYLRLGVLSIPMSLIVGAMLSTLRLTFQTKKFVILTTFGVLLQISFAIIFVIVYRLGVKGVLISILAASTLQTLLGVYFTYGNYTFALSGIWLKKLLKVGIPLIPAALSFWVMGYANRFFLVEYATMADIGLLSIVNRVSSILLLFLTAFSSAWGPYAYSVATDKELARETYRKVLTYFLLFSMTAAVGLSLFGRELILILATSTYEKGSGLIMIYSLSSISWVVLYIIGMGTGMAKKNYHYTISVVLGALLNTLFNYLLIPKFGVAGAAYSTLIGNLASTFYMFFAGQYYFKVYYEYFKVSMIIALSMFVTIGGIYFDGIYLSWDLKLIVFKIILFLLYIVLLFVFKVVNISLIKQGYTFVLNKINKKEVLQENN